MPVLRRWSTAPIFPSANNQALPDNTLSSSSFLPFRIAPSLPMKEMLEDFNATCKEAGVRTLSESGLTPENYYQSTLRFIVYFANPFPVWHYQRRRARFFCYLVGRLAHHSLR